MAPGAEPPPATAAPASSAAGAGSSASAASPAAIDGEPIHDTPAPRGRLVAVFDAGDQHWIVIDESGVARRVTLADSRGTTARVLPFSEPVENVVFARWSGGVKAPTEMYCARTRAGALECVTDHRATAKRPARRFRIPMAASVRHFNVRPSVLGSPQLLCALADAPACWTLRDDRLVSTRYDAYAATAIATGIPTHSLDPWLKVEPALVTEARELVHSSPADPARVVGHGADITVSCARLASDEMSCFGPGAYGELGDGKLEIGPRASSPLRATRIVDLAMANRYVCAVTGEGKVACWGELPSDLPLPRGHTATQLPMCTLDRAASRARFDAERAKRRRFFEECRRTCETEGRDACMRCTDECTRLPYVFRHDRVCQEPRTPEASPAHSAMRCIPPAQVPHWLADAQLRADTPEAKLTLSPVYLSGIDDAVGVVLPGRLGLCVLRRSGTLACLNEHGKLRPYAID